jgi:two-component system, LytTR family, sensor kinase
MVINAQLTHFLCYTTGAVLYGMLLRLALARRSRGEAFDPLPIATGILGLAWNLGSLTSLSLLPLAASAAARATTALSYGALGFLPAVVVHSALRGERAGVSSRSRRLVELGYALSALGAALQVHAALSSGPSSSIGLRLLTIAFLALAIPLLTFTRRRGYAARSAWLAALGIFAVTGFHMSHAHAGSYPWGVELVGHHASLPLAFAILFFDYRVAFADLFLKRAASFVGLVVMGAAALYALPGVLGLRDLTDPVTIGLVLVISLSIALVYPWLRSKIHAFVDRTVLRRADYGVLRQEIGALAAAAHEPAALLDVTVERLRAAQVAGSIAWIAQSDTKPGDDADAARLLAAIDPTRPETHDVVRIAERALVPIPTAEPPRFALVLRPLHGGRRLLSDELALLSSVALILARRLDALRLLDERISQEAREREMSKLTTEAELRALRAQLQPHFLFNALNTIGYLVRTSPDRAYDTLLLLTGLLRRVLKPVEPLVALRDELKIVEAYLEIERARFEERLRVSIRVPEPLQTLLVPPFLLQPLVENAIKHGISPLRQGGEVVIEGSVETATGGGPELRLSVRDTGAGATEHAVRRGRRDGVGLANVEQRLRAHYGGAASIAIASSQGQGTLVVVSLPAGATAVASRATGGRR